MPGMSCSGKSSSCGTRQTPRSTRRSPPSAQKDDVIRLDVAMDDSRPMQGRDGARQSRGDLNAFRQIYFRTPAQPRLQRLAIVIWHHRIEPGLSAGRQFDDFADPRASYPRGDPGFVDEGQSIGRVFGDARMRKLQDRLFRFACPSPASADCNAHRKGLRQFENRRRSCRSPAALESATPRGSARFRAHRLAADR